jgi:hypothetical protein
MNRSKYIIATLLLQALQQSPVHAAAALEDIGKSLTCGQRALKCDRLAHKAYKREEHNINEAVVKNLLSELMFGCTFGLEHGKFGRRMDYSNLPINPDTLKNLNSLQNQFAQIQSQRGDDRPLSKKQRSQLEQEAEQYASLHWPSVTKAYLETTRPSSRCSTLTCVTQ